MKILPNFKRIIYIRHYQEVTPQRVVYNMDGSACSYWYNDKECYGGHLIEDCKKYIEEGTWIISTKEYYDNFKKL